MNEPAKPKPKLVGNYGGIEVYTSETIPDDVAVLGYPDGRGGFKDGWVAVVGVGADWPSTLPTPNDQEGKGVAEINKFDEAIAAAKDEWLSRPSSKEE